MTDPTAANADRAATAATSSILVRVQARDEAAWTRFVDLYSPLIYAWCVDCGLTGSEIDDAAEHLFRRVLRHLDEFTQDPQASSFQRWIKSLALAEILQRKQPGEQTTVALYEETNIRTSDVDEARVLFHAALRQLEPHFPADEWRAFWRVTVEGEAPDEVARQQHLRVGKIFSLRSRILGRFREEFGDLIDVER